MGSPQKGPKRAPSRPEGPSEALEKFKVYLGAFHTGAAKAFEAKREGGKNFAEFPMGEYYVTIQQKSERDIVVVIMKAKKGKKFDKDDASTYDSLEFVCTETQARLSFQGNVIAEVDPATEKYTKIDLLNNRLQKFSLLLSRATAAEESVEGF